MNPHAKHQHPIRPALTHLAATVALTLSLTNACSDDAPRTGAVSHQDEAGEGCIRDTDCKGERICDLTLHACVDPNDGSTPIDPHATNNADLAGPCTDHSACEALGQDVFCIEGTCQVAEDYSPGPSIEAQRAWDTLGESGADGGAVTVGDVIDTFCEVPSYSNGNAGGTCCWADTHGSTIYGYKWQCTEFAFRFLCQHYNVLGCSETGKGGRRYGDARQWFGNELVHPVLAVLLRYPNGQTREAPQPGDVLVFAATVGNPFGHVAIVRDVNTAEGYVAVIEQNVMSTARDGNHRHRLHNDGGAWRIAGALGWMRVPNAWLACGAEVDDACPQGDALACGESLGLAAQNLYRCTAGVQQVAQSCPASCEVTPAGDDRCRAACDGIDCGGHGQCSEGGCVCDSGWAGPACQRCAEGYEGFPTCRCAANACQAAGLTSGATCAGNDRVTCGRQGECAVETARTPCGAGNLCQQGQCMAEPECRTDADCPASQQSGYGDCAGFTDRCDDGGTEQQTVTTWRCGGGSCAASTRTEQRGCTRPTNGTSCGTNGTCDGGRCLECRNACSSTDRNPRPDEHETNAGGQVLSLRATSVVNCHALEMEVRKADSSQLGPGTYHLRVGTCGSWGVIRDTVTLTSPRASITFTTDHRGATGDVKAFCATKVADVPNPSGAYLAWWWSNIVEVGLGEVCD